MTQVAILTIRAPILTEFTDRSVLLNAVCPGQSRELLLDVMQAILGQGTAVPIGFV